MKDQEIENIIASTVPPSGAVDDAQVKALLENMGENIMRTETEVTGGSQPNTTNSTQSTKQCTKTQPAGRNKFLFATAATLALLATGVTYVLATGNQTPDTEFANDGDNQGQVNPELSDFKTDFWPAFVSAINADDAAGLEALAIDCETEVGAPDQSYNFQKLCNREKLSQTYPILDLRVAATQLNAVGFEGEQTPSYTETVDGVTIKMTVELDEFGRDWILTFRYSPTPPGGLTVVPVTEWTYSFENTNDGWKLKSAYQYDTGPPEFFDESQDTEDPTVNEPLAEEFDAPDFESTFLEGFQEAVVGGSLDELDSYVLQDCSVIDRTQLMSPCDGAPQLVADMEIAAVVLRTGLGFPTTKIVSQVDFDGILHESSIEFRPITQTEQNELGLSADSWLLEVETMPQDPALAELIDEDLGFAYAFVNYQGEWKLAGKIPSP